MDELSEDSYGRRKRLDFVVEVFKELRPANVLDIGCGSGTQLTRPLAELFPDVTITGTDLDHTSIEWARTQHPPGNLCFQAPDEISSEIRYDAVIASEVLEHVEAPDIFLRELRARLAPGGRLIVTVPNGYGPFELMSLVEIGLNRSGLQVLLRRVKRALFGAARPHTIDTLAVSPHVNFFSSRELRQLFADLGLVVVRYRPRTILCGYLLDSALRHRRIAVLNATLADHLPAWCASDWMFELSPVAPPGTPHWRRGAWARLRKRLNECRWRSISPQ